MYLKQFYTDVLNVISPGEILEQMKMMAKKNARRRRAGREKEMF